MAKRRLVGVIGMSELSEEEREEYRQRSFQYTGNPDYAGTSAPGEYDRQEREVQRVLSDKLED